MLTDSSEQRDTEATTLARLFGLSGKEATASGAFSDTKNVASDLEPEEKSFLDREEHTSNCYAILTDIASILTEQGICPILMTVQVTEVPKTDADTCDLWSKAQPIQQSLCQLWWLTGRIAVEAVS